MISPRSFDLLCLELLAFPVPALELLDALDPLPAEITQSLEGCVLNLERSIVESAVEDLSCLSPFFESLVNISGLQLCASLVMSSSALWSKWHCASSSELVIVLLVTGDVHFEENTVTSLCTFDCHGKPLALSRTSEP